jgi:hypothetical protein
VPGLPELVEPVGIAQDEELVVYRVVPTQDTDSEDFLRSFMSHRALGLPPRGPETDSLLIYDGISVYDRREAAIETGRRYSALGRYVAQLKIGADDGITYFRWGPPSHLTLWGEPLKLILAVVDTIVID